jgi:hypothetical protein
MGDFEIARLSRSLPATVVATCYSRTVPAQQAETAAARPDTRV